VLVCIQGVCVCIHVYLVFLLSSTAAGHHCLRLLLEGLIHPTVDWQVGLLHDRSLMFRWSKRALSVLSVSHSVCVCIQTSKTKWDLKKSYTGLSPFFFFFFEQLKSMSLLLWCLKLALKIHWHIQLSLTLYIAVSEKEEWPQWCYSTVSKP